MTHTTDDKLDALVNLTEEFVTATWHLLDNSETSGPNDDPTITVWQPNFDEVSALLARCEGLPSGSMEHTAAGELLAANLNSAITSLRAQLAEARAELVRRVDMHECAMAERDDATLYSDEQKTRADRAEATLASLIEDAAQIAEAERKLWDRGYDTSPEGFAACRALAKARDSIPAALAASQTADPVTNAGCCQPVRVKPLVFEEARNGMWSAQHGYQIGHNGGPYYHVKLGDRSILKKIKGFVAAVKWANNHNTKRILSALEDAPRVNETQKSERDRADVLTALPAAVAPSLRITGPNSDGEYWLHIKAGGRSGGVNLGGERGPICKQLLDAASETGAKE